MHWISLGVSIVGVLGAGLTFWLKRPKAAAASPVVTGFAGMLQKAIALVEGLNVTDDVKHDLTADLLAVLKKHLATSTEPLDIGGLVRDEMATVLKAILERTPPPPATPPVSTAA